MFSERCFSEFFFCSEGGQAPQGQKARKCFKTLVFQALLVTLKGCWSVKSRGEESEKHRLERLGKKDKVFLSAEHLTSSGTKENLQASKDCLEKTKSGNPDMPGKEIKERVSWGTMFLGTPGLSDSYQPRINLKRSPEWMAVQGEARAP